MAVMVGMLAGATPALAKSNPPSPSAPASGGAAFIPGIPNSNLGAQVPGSSQQLGNRVLHLGMRGHDVRVLQTYLTVAGYGTMVDGVFGPQTQQNVMAFQQAEGTAPNGIVTFALAKSLRSQVATIQSAPPTGTARLNADGSATAPAGAPATVVAVIAAANQIINTSYCYGGGHGLSFTSSCYDCSGSVSFALHGGGLLTTPEDSIQFESYGDPGPGRWITIYANPSHAFMVVAGRGWNTATLGGPSIPAGTGPRWRANPLAGLAGGGYVVRHPAGL
jgi:peptidoglycan hydrolase-like protein with peptidoglycan-binding domain